MWMVVLKSPSMATFQVMRFGSLTAQMDECMFMFRWFGHVLAPFSWYTILRYRDALEQVFRWKFKFVRIVQINIWSVFPYSKHFFCIFFHGISTIQQTKKSHKGVALKASWRGIEHVVFPKWSSGVLHQVVLLALDEFSWCTQMRLENWPFDIKVCWNWNLGKLDPNSQAGPNPSSK